MSYLVALFSFLRIKTAGFACFEQNSSEKSAAFAKSALSVEVLETSTRRKRRVDDYPSGPDLIDSAVSLAKKDLNSVHSLKSNRRTQFWLVTSRHVNRQIYRTSHKTAEVDNSKHESSAQT